MQNKHVNKIEKVINKMPYYEYLQTEDLKSAKAYLKYIIKDSVFYITHRSIFVTQHETFGAYYSSKNGWAMCEIPLLLVLMDGRIDFSFVPTKLSDIKNHLD